jgi:hypothetical protein
VKKSIPWLISLVLSIWVISKMIPHRQAPGLDIDGFSRLPVLVGGRVMPMDTLARISLSVMNHHGTFTVDGKVEPASRWLLDVFMMPRRADAAKVFEVTNPDILGLFGRQEADGKPVSYSYNDCEPFLGEIGKQAGLATQTEAQTRNAFQRGILKLRDALRIYLLLKNSIQAEDSPDFARELQAFDQVLQPGVQAVRDREANRWSFHLERDLALKPRQTNVDERFAWNTSIIRNAANPIDSPELGVIRKGVDGVNSFSHWPIHNRLTALSQTAVSASSTCSRK